MIYSPPKGLPLTPKHRNAPGPQPHPKYRKRYTVTLGPDKITYPMHLDAEFSHHITQWNVFFFCHNILEQKKTYPEVSMSHFFADKP